MGPGAWLSGWLALVIAAAPVQADDDMLIIAHRGASGERPEHTLAAYGLAIDQGADIIEPDLVVTRDGVLIARHENELSGTTDVADRREFADRRTTKIIEGREATGWFAEDFTLAEIRALRARERLPEVRPANTAYDGLFAVPTMAEIIAYARAREAETGRAIPIYPELKVPAYLATQGHDVAAILLAQLDAAGYREAGDAMLVQSFDAETLCAMRPKTGVRLVQLIPADDDDRYRAMQTRDGLVRLSECVDAIGVNLALLIDDAGRPTPLIADAKAAGLAVHGWTARGENRFLPARHRRGDDANAMGDLSAYLTEIESAGIDGVFTDHPAIARQAR